MVAPSPKPGSGLHSRAAIKKSILIKTKQWRREGGAVASWLVHLSPDQVVRVGTLARVIALFSWARHFTLTVPLSTQVYKWVPANLMLGGNLAMN